MSPQTIIPCQEHILIHQFLLAKAYNLLTLSIYPARAAPPPPTSPC